MIRWKKIYPRQLQSSTIQKNLNQFLRTGQIVSVNSEEGTCDIRWYDRPGIRRGVLLTQANDKDFIIPEVGANVVVGFDSMEQARILRYINKGHADRVKTQHSLPKIKVGEKLLEVAGTIFHMKNNGDILAQTLDQNKIQLEASTGTFSTDTINIKNTSEAGVSFMGLIKRMVTNLGSKSIQFIKNTAGDYLTEYKLQITEKADNAVGNSEIPIIDISAGTVVDTDGNAIDHNGSVVLADSVNALCLDLTIQRNSVELLIVKISKDGKVFVNLSEEVTLQLAKKLLITAQEINLNNGTKGAARLDDEVTINVATGDIQVDSETHKNMSPITLTGTITKASSTIKIGD
jgi:hypothetical protein